jgi:signal transduction histidine kinase
MAKKIVDSHRGVIDVASRLGEGTTFTVRLPWWPVGAWR